MKRRWFYPLQEKAMADLKRTLDLEVTPGCLWQEVSAKIVVECYLITGDMSIRVIVMRKTFAPYYIILKLASDEKSNS